MGAPVRQRLLDNHKCAKEAYDRRTLIARLYEVGEIVIMKNTLEHTRHPSETRPKYCAPLAQFTEVLIIIIIISGV